MLSSRFRRRSTWLVMAGAALPALGGAQSTTRFMLGGSDIVRVDFASTRVGDFPSSLEMVDGIMEVVAMNGRNMLRASSRSVIRVPLPQVLPQDFTLEFEIIPKAGGSPEDLAIEGTPLINQGANSANVMWHRDYLQIVGGGATYDSRVPPSFAATLPSTLTQVVLSLQGETMRMFTNGRLMYTQSNRKFVRGRVLRVFLGGQDDGPNAVYLASLRVIDGMPVAPVVAANPPPNAGPGSGTATSTSSVTGAGTTPTATAAPVGTTGSIATVQQNPTVTTNAPATASGPISRANPASASNAGLLAPPAARTINLSGLTAAGVRLAAPTIVVPVYTGTGVFGAVAPRTIVLSSLTSAGAYVIATSRRIGLSAYAGAGVAPSAPGPQPRTIALSAVNASGVFGASSSRAIVLPVLVASGLTASPAARKITLPVITATGMPGLVAPRTITLVGWTAAGTRTP